MATANKLAVLQKIKQ